MKRIKHPKKIVLIGAGIMSATLGVLLKALLPKVQIDIYERLNKVGAESSDAWNNAGTGHAAFCELNYTPPKANGSCLLYTSPSPRDQRGSRMPSSA